MTADLEGAMISPAVRRRLDRIATRAALDPNVSGFALRVRHADADPSDDVVFEAADARHVHAVASSTKTAAALLVLRRVAAGQLALDQPLASILPRDELVGLNRFGGRDHADAFTVEQILAHTSGIPDYYERVRLDPRSDIAAITAADPGWSYGDALDHARALEAPFAPGAARAHYSGTNYQLVGRLLETVSGTTLADVMRDELFRPLGLHDTRLLTPDTLAEFDAATPLLFRQQAYRGVRRLASLGAEGAIVSSTGDMMTLLDAVLDGVAAPELAERWLSDFRPMRRGVDYGLGLMRFRLPRIATGLPAPGHLLGHAGMTGHVMAGDPVSGWRVVVAVNQLGAPAAAFRPLTAVLRALTRRG
ncbi:MAG TPA: serine hydrolase domain-containing protein [Microcella sp.]|nr:serine hydrolase domain-containing protein [Microcella sp.]